MTFRFTTLALAAALAAGGALAQDRSGAASDKPAAAPSQQSSGSDLASKMKSGMHSLGEKARHLFSRNNTPSTQDPEGDASTTTAGTDRSDTRKMGASGSDTSTGRDKRMDQAYGDWKSQQPAKR